MPSSFILASEAVKTSHTLAASEACHLVKEDASLARGFVNTLPGQTRCEGPLQAVLFTVQAQEYTATMKSMILHAGKLNSMCLV